MRHCPLSETSFSASVSEPPVRPPSQPPRGSSRLVSVSLTLAPKAVVSTLGVS